MLQAVALVGEFNNWDPQAEHWAARNNFGVWQLFLPDTDGASAIPHRQETFSPASKFPKKSPNTICCKGLEKSMFFRWLLKHILQRSLLSGSGPIFDKYDQLLSGHAHSSSLSTTHPITKHCECMQMQIHRRIATLSVFLTNLLWESG